MIVWPDRLLSDIAATASQAKGDTVSVHTIRLALGFRYRAHIGMSLDEVCEQLEFSRGYGRTIARQFGIDFPDYIPANPLNLPLE